MNINLKKVISSVAALAMSLSCFTAFAADFTDVEATASYKTAIDKLVALEIVNGYEDGSFKPDNEITRAEVTKMVVAAMGDSFTAAAESSKGNSGFSDVDAVNHWASGFISVGVAQKFINGMGDGTFAPDSNVTYAQIVKMLVAALGYDTQAQLAGGYPNGYLQIGSQIGVTAGVTGLGADTAVTRAHVAQLISNSLDIPLVTVVGWSQNYVTGAPIAETAVQDGTKGQDYKTLLTEYHDAYVVRGRVIDTKAMNATVKTGTVTFRVELSDNFDEDSYKAAKDDTEYSSGTLLPGEDGLKDSSIAEISAFFGDTNAEELLFTYSEAIIQKNADEDYEIVTIVPYGKNEIVEVAAKDFDAYTPGTPDTLSFFEANSSSKSKDYKIDANAIVYVNGISLGSVASNYATYIQNNKIGKVTLIDTPAAGTTSKDGKFDYVMVTFQKYAIIDSTAVAGDNIKIYFDEVETGVSSAAPVIIDVTNEDAVYSFYKDGVEVEFETLKAGDVVLMTYDPQGAPAASAFISFDICDTVVEGRVDGIKTKNSRPVYTIGEVEYSYTEDTSSTPLLAAGSEYTLYLDAAGRIVDAVENVTTKNFGVIDRQYQDGSTQEEKVRIIKADGTREVYNLKSTVVSTANTIAYSSGTTLRPVINRAVSYKLNSKGEIFEITQLNAGGAIATGLVVDDYKESATKIAGVYMSESTQILDLSKFYTVGGTSGSYTASEATYTAADIKAGSLSTFIDGEEYAVLAFDQANDKTYRFVVVLKGNAAITELTNFAVVDSYETVDVDGMARTAIYAYTADSKGELVKILISEDCTAPAAFNRGDVVVFALDGNGEIEKFEGAIDSTNNGSVDADEAGKIFAPASTIAATAAAMFGKSGAELDSDPDGLGAFFTKSAVSRWVGSTGTDYARTGFGIIMDKRGSNVTIAKAVQAGSSYSSVVDKDGTGAAPASTDWVTDESFMVDLSLAADANVYVYDYGQRDEAMLYAGTVIDTVVPDSAVLKNGSNDFYNWTTLSAGNIVKSPVYAFYKTVDGDITDILVIVPAV